MILNEKVINYKKIDLMNQYNFGIKFYFIRDHIKSYNFFRETIVGTGHAITRP